MSIGQITRTAIITGGASGLGLGIRTRLCPRNDKLAVTDKAARIQAVAIEARDRNHYRTLLTQVGSLLHRTRDQQKKSQRGARESTEEKLLC